MVVSDSDVSLSRSAGNSELVIEYHKQREGEDKYVSGYISSYHKNLKLDTTPSN